MQRKIAENNLHSSFRFLLIIAQIFGYFPIQGVLSKNISQIRFTWFSPRVLMSLFTVFLSFYMVLEQIKHMIILGYTQAGLNGVVFSGCGAISCFLFLLLAREWPVIVRNWRRVDQLMVSYGWPKNLNKRIKICSCVFLLLEAAEHVSIQMNKILVAVSCKGSLLKGFQHFCENMSFPYVFDEIPYTSWFGIVLQINNTTMAFSWTFTDLFIMLMSISLHLRFQQITERVRSYITNNVKSERSWEILREDYNKLCFLCEFLDDKLSFLILLSFFNNFYFIIFQVLISLQLQTRPPLETVYYFISLSLLMLRITSICLFGSWVHEESRKPLQYLNSSSWKIYNKEIARFIETVTYQYIGFTGKNLFRITKGLILKITSGVVTYELVVIQFNQNYLEQEHPSLNSFC